ncbi:MAG: PD-(D/E)XK nuclease family protein [Erysipelotrichaceae bacterium]|nr:PD-(D/E)XK nuclease family protein [Erysipelotrichaceae bacterium]
MNITDYLNDDTLIICPSEVKMAALRYLNESRLIRTVKFMNMEEYRRNYFFDYDENAILAICRMESCKPAIARMYLDNLCYVEDRDYGNEKLNRLVEIKKDLQQKGLLKFNPLFHKWLDTVDVVVYGYGRLDEFNNGIIKGRVVEYPRDDEKIYDVYEFDNLEDEVEYLFNSICDLLNEGTDINNIYITNMTNEYETAFQRFEKYYGITVDYRKSDSIVGTPLVRQFMEWLEDEDNDHQKIYDLLQPYSDYPVYSQLVHILNKYIQFPDLKEVRDLIHEDLLNTRVFAPQKRNVIRNIAMFSELTDKDHLFVLSFNDSFPKMKTDTDYISDNIKNLVGLDDSEAANQLIKYNVQGYLSTVRNLHLSYSKNSSFEKHLPTNLTENISFRHCQPSYEYSEAFNKVRLSYQLEEYLKYRTEADMLPQLYGNYGSSSFQDYNNKFTGLSREQISQMENKALSYSSMNSYYECAFRYYLERRLGISRNETTFYSRLGELFHEVLSRCFVTGYDLENDFERDYRSIAAEQKTAQDEKEQFFVEKLKDDLRSVIKIIREQNGRSLLTSGLYENDVNWPVSGQKAFTGKIDKLIYFRGEKQTLTAIIDYKTGKSVSFRPELNEFGLSMQLPCYLFLLDNFEDSKLGDREKIVYCGMYLQHIVPSRAKYDENKTEEDQMREFLRLEGYSLKDRDIMGQVDESLTDTNTSKNIKSLRIKKDGEFYADSKVLTEEEMKVLIALTRQKIEEARKAIGSGAFSINPKVYGGKNVSCRYCDYGDICYRRFDDNVYLDNQQYIGEDDSNSESDQEEEE